MAGLPDLRSEQRRVKQGALPALVITITVFVFAISASGSPVSVTEAARMAVVAMLAPALCLMAAVGNVGNRRFFSATDIGAATSADRTQPIVIASAILLNTLEQAVLAIMLYAALAILLPDPRWLLIGLPVLFVVGRLCFALGYSHGAGARAFGFGLTFYPHAIGFVYATFLALN